MALPFDDDELAGITVADVLADPAASRAPHWPIRSRAIEYGPCKAKIMRRADGTPGYTASPTAAPSMS